MFDVFEALLTRQRADDRVEVTSLSNQAVRATGRQREISPAVDPLTRTVRVKVGLEDPLPEMTLGAPVAGAGRFDRRDVVVVP